jgi:hypothetical protein
MKAASVLKSIMTGKQQPGTLPAELITTDRILERWAADSGSGLPTDEWDDRRQSRPVPLDDDTWLVVDLCVRKAPDRSREFIVRWYKSPLPTSVQAKKAGMAEMKYKQIHALTLHFMKHRLEEAGNATLRRLLAAVG